MKTLNDYINESLLDDLDDLEQISDYSLIKKFLDETYHISGTIDIKDNIVNVSKSVSIKNKRITHLTNGLFKFGKVDGMFRCSSCSQLKSLEGAPEYVGTDFGCECCNQLTSLEGAPEYVGNKFRCSFNQKLTSLKGAPKYVGNDFYCNDCPRLASLEGAPEEVGGNFYAMRCKVRFDENALNKIKAKGTKYGFK